MIEKKGQHLLNMIYYKLKIEGYQPTPENIDNKLFFMSDIEFDSIMNMSDKESMEFYNKNI